MGQATRQFEQVYGRIRTDIFAFCQELNFQPTWQQAQLLEVAQRGDPFIAVKSGQGPGKSTASAVVALWWVLRHVDSLCVVTAPTMRQCTEIWMGAVRQHHSRANPWFRKFVTLTNTRVTVAGRTKKWGIQLVSANREENAAGWHNDHLMILVEEASGVERGIITTFKGTLKNEDKLFLMIGNPTNRDCAFFDCFTSQKDTWTNLTFNSEQTPESEWFTQESNREIEKEFGRNSDVYRIRVLGEFPHTDPNCVLSIEDLQRVTDTKDMLVASVAGNWPDGNRIRQIGIDFARFGGDESVVFRRQGNAIVEWKFFARTEPDKVVDAAFAMQANAGWNDGQCWYVADAGGLGQGIMHKFHNAGKQVLEFHNGGKAADQQYANKITEAWFELAKLVRAGKCYMPDDRQLMQQLTSRRYYTNAKGKLILETKDEYMRRGNDSPDRADAIVMAFYDQIIATGRSANGDERNERAA